MKTIILISCGKAKQKGLHQAQDMYTGTYFKKSLEYAKHLDGHIYILSAKYGLLELDEVISDYEYTLNNKGERIKKNWSYKVIRTMLSKGIKKQDKIIFLAGKSYNKYLKRYFTNYIEPTKGLRMGETLAFYNKMLYEINQQKN